MSSVILKSMLAVALGWVRISVELDTEVSLLSIRHRETDETTLDALLELSDKEIISRGLNNSQSPSVVHRLKSCGR